MLYKFLAAKRAAILSLARAKTAGISEGRPITTRSQSGLPYFYTLLVSELKRESHGLPKRHIKLAGSYSTAMHGKELWRLGYTVSQVVHGYGVICQAITELAHQSNATITAREFSVLNLCLDVAIADAVTGFSHYQSAEGADSTKRMGFLVHELRNALAAAVIAQSMLKKGVVGPGGSTNALLERNLTRMRDILDRSFSEVRMKVDHELDRGPVHIFRLVAEIEATASEEARARGLQLAINVDPALVIDCDRHYMTSALSNLLQNAIKYTKRGETIRVRSRETRKTVIVEVEDRCGGLPPGKAAELFRPYTQKDENRTGLGLGLTISRKAVALHGGKLEVRNLPGKGCVFFITLPKRKRAAKRPATKRSRKGRPSRR